MKFAKSSLLYLGLLLIILLLVLAYVSTLPAEISAATAIAGSTPQNQAVVPDSKDASCFRPYTDDSIWNTPIDWSKARIHPQNDVMLAAFFKDTSWIGSDPTQFAPNVYFATNQTPLVAVRLRQNRYRDASNDVNIQYGLPGGVIMMPIPAGAVPAPGTDGQMVVVNLDTGEEWGINKGEIDSSGQWVVGGAYRYNIANSGLPPDGFGQRGGGIGQLAGIVRRCEVERGSIDHAVTLAYDFPCTPETCALNGWPSSAPPFTTTDGRGTDTYDIPEGARIAIRPEITMDQIHGVCHGIKGCEAWARAMQEYGGFIVDDAGHPKTYAEGDATAHWDPKLWTPDMLHDIPSNWYVVIDWNFPSTKAP